MKNEPNIKEITVSHSRKETEDYDSEYHGVEATVEIGEDQQMEVVENEVSKRIQRIIDEKFLDDDDEVLDDDIENIKEEFDAD